MNPKKYLENRIRGWLPKEPNLPSFPTTISRKNEQSRKIKFLIVVTLGLGEIKSIKIYAPLIMSRKVSS